MNMWKVLFEESSIIVSGDVRCDSNRTYQCQFYDCDIIDEIRLHVYVDGDCFSYVERWWVYSHML